MKILSLLSLLLLSLNVLAKHEGLMAHNPYVRLMPASAANTAAFMTLMNHTDKEAVVVKAEVVEDIANKIELHDHINENGVMRMREVKEIKLSANSKVTLKPGSLHIMLMGLKRPLKEKQEITFKLHFADKSIITFKAPVQKIETESKHHNHDDHHHH
jgi:periplasmic copper chaperone A